MFEIYILLALGALPLGPHGGHTYYLNNFESSTPKDDSCSVWLNSNHVFSRRRWNSYFLHWAPHPRGPMATLGTVINNFYSSPKKVYTQYSLTVLHLDLEKMFEIYIILALGGSPPGPPWGPCVPLEQLWIPYPWGRFLPSLVKIQPCVFKKKMKM